MYSYSLRRRLLRRLLLPLLPILLLGAVFAYLFALRAAMNAYDLGLLNEALDLSKQVEFRENALTIDLPLAAQQMLQSNNQDREAYVAWDSRGRLISGSQKLQLVIELHPDDESLFHDIVLDGEANRAIVLKQQLAGRTYYIAISQTLRGRNKLTGSTFIGILLPEALLALVSITVVMWGVRRGLSPVDALRDEISSRSSSDLRPIQEAAAPEELSPIIHGINELLGNLAAAFASHRRFIADAAHQLRTPLASLSSQIEVALKSPPVDIKEFLRQLLATTQRTTHLSNQLLSLARLEHTEQFMYEITTVDFKQIILDTSADFVSLAARKEVELDFELQTALISGSPLMLREMLANLLDNAVRYTPAGGQIHVTVQTQSPGIQLTVENNGPVIPDAELGKLGTPFHSPPSSKPDGCGLGLAIVLEIARLHHADVSFKHGRNNEGLRVCIHFPLSAKG